MRPSELWAFLPIGYAVTVLIEAPILIAGLSKPHPFRRRLFAGFWLTACTYPIVVLVLPLLIAPRIPYLVVAETFAPVAECLLFRAAYPDARWRDYVVITLANLASFTLGAVVFGQTG